MRRVWLLLLVALLLAISGVTGSGNTTDSTDTATCSGDGCNAVDERDDTNTKLREGLLGTKWTNTDSASELSMDFLNKFPRYNTDVRRFNASDTSEFSSEAQDYILGLAYLIAVPLFLSIMALLCCWMMCICRACDWCGGRHATQGYTPKQINCYRIMVCLLCICMGVTAALTWSANVGVSESMDSFFIASDNVAEYVSDSLGLLTTSAVITSKAAALIGRVQISVDNGIPSANESEAIGNCLNDTNSNYTTFLLTANQIYQHVRQNMENVGEVQWHHQRMMDMRNDTGGLKVLASELQAFNQSHPRGKITQSFLYSLGNLSSFWIPTVKPLVEDAIAKLTTYKQGFNKVSGSTPHALYLGAQFNSSVYSLPDLWLLARNITDNTSTTQSHLLAGLDALNTSVYDWPNIAQWKSQQDALCQGRAYVLQNATAVNSSLGQVRSNWYELDYLTLNFADIADAIDVETMRTLDTRLSNFTALARWFNFTDLKVRVVPLFTNATTEMKQNSILISVTDQMQSVNSSIEYITCNADIMKVLLDFNTSIAKTPPELDEVMATADTAEPVLRASGQLVTDYATMIQKILDINTTLTDGTPDLSSYSQVYANLSSFSEAFPSNYSWDLVSAESGALLTVYLYADAQFNSTLWNILLSNANASYFGLGIGTFQNRLDDVNDTLAATDAVPVCDQLPWYVANETAFKDAINASVFDVVRAGYPTEGMTPSVQSMILEYLNGFNDTLQAMPEFKHYLWQLDVVNDTLDAVSPDIDTMLARLSDLNESLYAFPADFSAILGGLEAVRGNTSRVSDYPELVALMDTYDFAHFAYTLDEWDDLWSIVQATTSLYTDYVDSGAEEHTTAFLDENGLAVWPADQSSIQSFVDRLNDLVTLKGDLIDFLDLKYDVSNISADIVDARNDADEKYQDYYDERNSVKKTADEYDGYRLLFFCILAALPFALSFCAIASCGCKYGPPSMCMALLYFFLIFVLGLLVALTVLPSTILVDHCIDVDDYAYEQLEDKLIVNHTEEFMQKLGVNQSLFAVEAYDYFVLCKGEEPHVLTRLGQPEDVLADNNLTIDQVIDDHLTSLADGYNLTLSQEMNNHVDDARSLVDDLEGLMVSFKGRLVCEQTSPMLNGFRSAICDDFTPVAALWVCGFLLMVICMIPGIFCGFKGYKKFNPDNTLLYQIMPTEDDSDED